MRDDKVYTVTGLTKDIRFLLEDTFPDVWVEGEVSNHTVSSAGHAYFSLKDKASVLNCVLFRGSGSRVAFRMEDGMKVLCRGRVSVYDKRGQYQLYVSGVEPRGRGSLQIAFEQLKKKLLEEGLFDQKHKKELPMLPTTVGVVTSPTGAAVRDILNVARRRFANVEILIRPVRVQGGEAKKDIAEAIKELNEFNRQAAGSGGRDRPIDVIIVGRGGGSLEDLWPFNEEEVARAIFASKIPVISAVGHEVDYTISDFTADFRAPTPSAAAELVIPLKEDLVARITGLGDRMYLAVKGRTDLYEKEVSRLGSSYVLRAPMNVLLRLEQQVDELARSSASSARHAVELAEKDLGVSTGKLSALSPLAVLERGYSITFKDGKAVKKAGGLKKGDLLVTRFAEGQASSRVEDREKGAVDG